MRKRHLFSFAFAVLVSGSSALAQTGDSDAPQPVTQYTWRSPSNPSPAPAVGKVILTAPQRSGTSVAPIQVGSIRVVPLQEDTEPGLADLQSSVSDQPVTPAPDPTVLQAKIVEPAPIPSPPAEVAAEIPAQEPAALESVLHDDGQAIPQAPGHAAEQPVLAYQPALGIIDAGDPVETNYCNRNCRKSRCNLGCEKKLFGKNCNGLEIGGWTSLGYHNRNTNVINDRKSELNLHQSWLYFEKQAGVTSNWGYRADVLYGIDAQNLQAFGNAPLGAPAGWDNGWDNGSYGWALPQLYVQYNNDLWDVKIGKFISPFGYEVVAANENFFYSHSYTMNYSEPFTMTGVLGERQVSDTMSTIFGATVGWDSAFERNTGGFNVITGTRYTPNDFINLALTSSYGDTGVRDTGTMTSAVAQMKLTESVDYVIQGDMLNLRTNDEFGIVQYLFREVTPCLKLGARLEWWKSDQLFTRNRSTYEFTVGANYRANANITLRPELRFDWGAAAVDPGTPIIGIDAVITY